VHSLSMLVQELDQRDRIAIAVYAGSSGLVLDSTAADSRESILQALERLQAGGSTNGGAGIRLAYQVARDNFADGGINRVILATDGDFNVGTTSQDELVRLIEQEARTGVFLTVLGFGTGNLQDSLMEKISGKGNGHYAYIDSKMEARKVLVEELGGTLEVIAKDVKLQVEFNPTRVAAYRLIGYENRMLAARDFADDTKDAGEVGAGHRVTALYEVIPAGRGLTVPGADPLKYQQERQLSGQAYSGEICTLKMRYKQPNGNQSQLVTQAVLDEGAGFQEASADTRFATAVAAFGMVLRDSEYRGSATLASVQRWAAESVGDDPGGYRTEFLELVQRARSLKN
jgi:Ca-activated chloride channel family protein